MKTCLLNLFLLTATSLSAMAQHTGHTMPMPADTTQRRKPMQKSTMDHDQMNHSGMNHAGMDGNEP